MHITKPLASVLCITYNQAKYIAEAIERFLAQKADFDFEIIIGDDCSSDETRSIVSNYAERHPETVRVVSGEANSGIMCNFLRTFESCRGKYIAMCEGDDYWHDPYKLQKQVNILERNPHYGMTHSDFDVLVQGGARLRAHYRRCRAEHSTESPDLGNILEGKYRFTTSTACCRRETMSAVISNDPFSFKGDFMAYDAPLFVGMAAAASVKFLDESLATYRRHKESVTGTRDHGQRAAFAMRNYTMHRHLIVKYEIQEPAATRIIACLLHGQLALAYWARDRKAVIEVFRRMRDAGNVLSFSSRAYYWGLRVPVLDFFVRPALSLRKWWINREHGL